MSAIEASRVGRNAVVYLVPNLLLRGLTFLLTPILTRYLTPTDYGVVGLSTTFTMLFGIVLGLAIHGSVTRMHYECASDHERSVFYGTLLTFLVLGSGAGAALVELVGLVGAFDGIRSVRFHPHLEMALWTAYAQLFVGLRTTMLQAREEARSVATLSAAGVILQTIVSLFLVIAWGWGAIGVLGGQLAAQVLLGAFSVVAVARESTFRFSRTQFVRALTYTLPLLPHLAANWGLSVSDRIVLERSVSGAQLGVYALGYMFCTIAAMVATAIGDAFSPAVMRLLRVDGGNPTVPALGTLAVASIGFACTGAAVLGGDAIMLFTPASYWDAVSVVPWVVLGAAFQGLYLVVAQGTWFSMKTAGVPVVTVIAAAVNVGMNVLLVPRFGIMAAAVNTAVAYAVTAFLHDRLAAHLHPIAWEYGKWARIGLVGLVCFAFASATHGAFYPLGLAIRVAIALLAYPVLVHAFGVTDLRSIARRTAV